VSRIFFMYIKNIILYNFLSVLSPFPLFYLNVLVARDELCSKGKGKGKRESQSQRFTWSFFLLILNLEPRLRVLFELL